MKERSKALWALALVCFFWGTTYFAIRVAVTELPPALFCSVRFFLAGLPMLFYALWRGEALPKGRDWLDLAVIGILLLAVGNGTLSWAEQWVPSGIASLIVVTTPLWMAVFAHASGESVRARAVAGLLVGFLGLGILLWPDMGRARPGSGFLWGAAALLFSSMVWALGSVYSKRRPPRTGPVMTVAVEMLVGGVLFAVVGLLAGQAALWHPSARAWLALVYLAGFGSILGYGAYLYALTHLPTVQVSVYAYVNPVVAVLLGVLFLGERLDVFMLAGIPIMLGGVYLVSTAPAAEATAPWPKRWFKT